jgi:uncharacterized membrane protein YheB (UPF0754 family)
MNTVQLVAVPLVASLIGWITNYIAVRMLFRPRRPYRILGVTILGLIPKRQSELARSIGDTVESQLLTAEDLANLLNTPDTQERVHRAMINQVDAFLNQFAQQNPMFALFLQGDLAQQIKDSLVQQLQAAVPGMLEELLGGLKGKVNIGTFISRRVEALELDALEQLVYRVSANELKTIELLGGVLGFLVGCIQVAFMAFFPT